MKGTGEKLKELIDLLESTAAREIRIWTLLLPGHDRWRLFAEYREYCEQERSILFFIEAARAQIARTAVSSRRELMARVAEIEASVRRAGAPVHRRYLEALSEPDVPLPLGCARFLRQQLVTLARLDPTVDLSWTRPIAEVARALSHRAHELEEFGPAH